MKPLRLLLVEDSEDDALLVLRELRRGGYEPDWVRVETAQEMGRQLMEREWDIVISDYSLPNFSAPAALTVMRESNLDLPFIITSGTVGEETAVEALRAGAHDFMLKSRLTRLVPAVEREMKDAADRRAHRASADEVKRLEEQVRHAQKMEAIGRLAGGVAHDFNNILTAIMATADLALETPGLSREMQEDLRTIRESGAHAASITRQLLAFSRKQVVQPRSMDPNELVARSESLLRRLVPHDVSIVLDLMATGAIEADPTQIEQILVNLVVNAGDAMPNGGTLVVATADEDIEGPRMIGSVTVPPGRYTVLRVRDTGTGMSEETRRQIFEPFFTTKAAGHGTGLGLATVYGIVHQSGGYIDVQSAPGQGSTFEMFLPRTAELPAPVAATNKQRFSSGGNEVILVVEDETTVRAPMCRALRQLGYFVLEAKHGEDALIVMQQHQGQVHLVITDMVMPEMSGAELVRRVHDWFPRLKVLFVSGYSEELIASQGALANGASYLPKPFTGETLAARVRLLLDEGTSFD